MHRLGTKSGTTERGSAKLCWKCQHYPVANGPAWTDSVGRRVCGKPRRIVSAIVQGPQAASGALYGEFGAAGDACDTGRFISGVEPRLRWCLEIPNVGSDLRVMGASEPTDGSCPPGRLRQSAAIPS